MKLQVIILSTLMITSGYFSKAQDDLIGMEITMQYFRTADNTITILAEVYDEEDYEPIMDLPFNFYSISEDQEVLLGTAQSNEDAFVELSKIPFDKVLVDPSGNINIKIVGENDSFFGEGELTVRYVDLKIIFELEDSIKILRVNLNGIDDEGNKVGVADGEVYFFVPRLFGQLQIGEAWTDDEGVDQISFPLDLKGDENGLITVIAKIRDSEDFGNIEVKEEINWGIPRPRETKTPRALWSSRAPFWMLFTFILLMTGVFVHYIWVVVNLFKIKKLGR